MADIKDRVIGAGKSSSIIGAVVSTAIAGAAQYYEQTGGAVRSWQPYAIAGGIALAGLLHRHNK